MALTELICLKNRSSNLRVLSYNLNLVGRICTAVCCKTNLLCSRSGLYGMTMTIGNWDIVDVQIHDAITVVTADNNPQPCTLVRVHKELLRAVNCLEVEEINFLFLNRLDSCHGDFIRHDSLRSLCLDGLSGKSRCSQRKTHDYSQQHGRKTPNRMFH